MIAAIISQYLKENRRLVIPQLGAFLVKEPDHRIVFSPLLTRDDGVLRQLLLDSGMSEVVAVGAIDRLLFDVRFVMENGGDYLLEGVGRFAINASGQLHFETDTVSRRAAAAQKAAQVVPQLEVTAEPQQEVPTAAAEPQNPFFMFDKEAKESPQEATSEVQVVAEQAPSQEPFAADPDLEDLNYGESNVGRSNRTRASRHTSTPKRRRGGVDWWLMIGIVALLLALGSILYGFLREGAEPLSLPTFVGQESQH